MIIVLSVSLFVAVVMIAHLYLSLIGVRATAKSLASSLRHCQDESLLLKKDRRTLESRLDAATTALGCIRDRAIKTLREVNPLGIAFVLCLAFAGTAHASGWQFLPHGNHFVRSNGFGNDGFLYSRSWNGCRYTYSQHSAIVAEVPVVSTPTYNANWKSELVNHLSKAKDNETFLQALRESGLSRPGYSGSVSQYSTSTHVGFPAAHYGIAAYGVGQPLDINAVFSAADRHTENAQRLADRADAHFKDRLGQAVDASRVEATGRAFAAALQASATPVSTTSTVNVQSQESSTSGPARPALATVYQDTVFATHCASCHSGTNRKGSFDVDALNDAARESALRRIFSDDPKLVMPPLDKPRLTFEEKSQLMRGSP